MNALLHGAVALSLSPLWYILDLDVFGCVAADGVDLPGASCRQEYAAQRPDKWEVPDLG